MNKKGFTTVELILTIAVVVTIISTIAGVTYVYRDRSIYESTLTSITDYKNTLTKIIYDDVIDVDNKNGKVTSISKINDNSYQLVIDSNNYYDLNIINEPTKVGIEYNGISYIIPDSSKSLITFDHVDFQNNDDLFSLDIYFTHITLSKTFKIHIVVSN